jgi:dihydrodipicolinate synthase/N-acetylneuraminate lyase
MQAAIFRGTIPALMTPCTNQRQPDFGALVRKGKELVEAGMSAVVYCGSMGDWPLLTDEQRMEGVEQLVGAGLPVIVGTGAQNPARAAALAAHAKRVGAKGLMIIPRVLSRGPSAAAQRAHFAGILEAATKSKIYSVAMVAYNVINHAYVAKALAAAHKKGLGVIAMKVARPVFSGRPNGPDTPARAAKIDAAVPGSLKRPLKAYSWALRSPHVSAVVSEMVNRSMVDENLPLAAPKAKA